VRRLALTRKDVAAHLRMGLQHSVRDPSSRQNVVILRGIYLVTGAVRTNRPPPLGALGARARRMPRETMSRLRRLRLLIDRSRWFARSRLERDISSRYGWCA
jgi:hypothetical protein